MRVDRRSSGLALLVAVLAVVAALLAGCGPDSAAADGAVGKSAIDAAAGASGHAHVKRVPEAAWHTLSLIDAGDWPAAAEAPGTQGGRRFGNREKRLPQRSDGSAIRYREWDVNPKKAHHSRDANRIVTGDDGSAWYTGDHYSTFTRMR